MKEALKILRNIFTYASKVGKGKFVYEYDDELDVKNESISSIKTVKVEKPGAWSSFEYLFDPKNSSTVYNKEDDRVYFSVPVSYDYDNKIVYHYMFPVGATDSEIVLYYTDLSNFYGYSGLKLDKVENE